MTIITTTCSLWGSVGHEYHLSLEYQGHNLTYVTNSLDCNE